jgi:hypothetical protein
MFHGQIGHEVYMDRLDMKFIVIALDHKTHDYLRLNTTMETIFMNTASASGITEDSATFRSAQFNFINARKKEAVSSSGPSALT